MNLKNLKIETIYKDSEGNIIDKKDIPKAPRITALIKDKYGFEYKTKKSKCSAIKKYFIEPIKKEENFHYSEDSTVIKIENDSYILTYNKKNNIAEINSVLAPIYSKGYVTGRTTLLKEISLPVEDVQSVKDDRSLFNILVESN
jgi:hypothetical protein